MSPLACSLLALAALLTVATAKLGHTHALNKYGDAHVWYGHKTPFSRNLNSVELSPSGGNIELRNHCDVAHPLTAPEGEHIVVKNGIGDCNPTISGTWNNVIVQCTVTVDCTCDHPIHVYVRQYCPIY